MADADKKAEYKEIAREQQLPNAYTAAVTEYMRKPEILGVEMNSGVDEVKEIKIFARKKGFQLKEVEIIVLDENNAMLDKGRATKGVANIFSYSPKVLSDRSIQLIIRVSDNAEDVTENRYFWESGFLVKY